MRVIDVQQDGGPGALRAVERPDPDAIPGMAPHRDDAEGPARRVRLLLILGALSAFAPLSIDMYLPALPALGRGFGVSAAQVQVTLSSCLLGLALGQLVVGPLSDALGRRRPLLAGVAAYTVASLLCVLAPSVGVLVVVRFIQGLAGAAAIVIARAVVRDRYAGVAAARYFSLLILVNGLAPILAPLIGGQLLRVTSWRGVFVVLAAIGALLLLATVSGLGETLAPADRRGGGLSATLEAFRRLLADRSFVGYALSSGFSFAAMFAYIAGSPFVLQGIYGVSPQLFSVVFGCNALGLVAASQITGRLVGRVPLPHLLAGGLTAIALGGLALLAAVVSHVGLIGVLPALFVVVSSQGIVLPTATSLALSGPPRTAGSASALLGVLQYGVGAICAPLVGLGGTANALPMAVVIAVLSVVALATALLLIRPPAGPNAVVDNDAQVGVNIRP